jgi:predicted DNA-binding protein (MmcQ/YjbR family)
VTRPNYLARARKICLALPEAHEKIAWGAPTFRVRNKQFAMFLDNHHGDGRIALWCKAPSGAQELLVGADPERFYVPPYVGPAGWIGIHLDKGLDWGVIAGLVRDGYREIAPKRLLLSLDSAPRNSKRRK